MHTENQAAVVKAPFWMVAHLRTQELIKNGGPISCPPQSGPHQLKTQSEEIGSFQA